MNEWKKIEDGKWKGGQVCIVSMGVVASNFAMLVRRWQVSGTVYHGDSQFQVRYTQVPYVSSYDDTLFILLLCSGFFEPSLRIVFALKSPACVKLANADLLANCFRCFETLFF